jgi:two-component sensor histidine kinase
LWRTAADIDGDAVAWTFPAGYPLHAHQARSWLAAYLATVWSDSDAVFSAEVAASELFTNASVHGAGSVSVIARADANLLLLEVGDDSPQLPAIHNADDDDEHGRGLHIVDALAVCWRGQSRVFGGKTIQVVLGAAPCR